MRILVTGGAGYIGSHTVKLLLERGHSVTVFDNLSAGHKQAVRNTKLVVADLSDAATLDHVFINDRIEGVIHFAASAYVGESVTNPSKYYLNNLANSLNLLERVRRQGITRFVFSSTCATYGIPEKVPITEEEPQQPINPYGNTKLAFERMLADYAPAHGIGSVALRYFNAAGAAADGSLGEDHSPETHLIPIVLQTALGKRSHVEVFGNDYPTPDGTCIRDYVHVEDLAEAHLLALEKLVPGEFHAFNIGTGTGSSVKEVIAEAESITGKTVVVRYAPRRAGDPPKLVASAKKIHEHLGWKPKYPDVRSIIETAWTWFKQHPNGYAG